VLWLALLATTAAAATSTSGSGSTPAPAPTVSVSGRQRLAGVVAGGLVLAAGLALLGGARTYYLGAILAWAGPVLALQWGFGWPYLWASRRTLVLGTGVPTVYLWVADWAAIDLGIWVISETYTTGVTLVGLPVEEAAFFLVTTLFVVQGLVLFLWVVERWGWTTASPEAARDERSRPVEGWSDDPAAGVVAHSHRVASSERTDGGREPRGPHERQ
jgi:lycopene cyclase domain-containing protein